MATIHFGLGSNIAPRENISLALREMQSRFGVLSVSNTYRNAPVGFSGADFMNLVVRAESDKTPLQVCRDIEAIHNLSGRVRGANKWDSRPLDIDLLLYNGLVCDEKPVRVPRGDVLKYSFVLRPLAELSPNLTHPVTGKTMLEHWQEFDSASHPLQRVDVEYEWSGNAKTRRSFFLGATDRLRRWWRWR